MAVVVLGLLAALGWLLFVRRAPLGYVPEWFMRVNGQPWPAGRLLGAVGTIVGFGGLAAYIAFLARRHREDRWGKWCRGGFVAALVLGAFWLQVAIVLVCPVGLPSLVAATYSDVSTEYFAAAWKMDEVGEYLRTYHEQMRGASYHVGTHPPGAVLVYYGLIRAFYLAPGLAQAFGGWLETTAGLRAGIVAAWGDWPGAAPMPKAAGAPAAFCSLALAFFGALSVVPIYFLAKVAGRQPSPIRQAPFGEAQGRQGKPPPPLPGGEGRAMACAALFATVPSLLLFVPTLDQLLLLFAACALALMVAGWRRSKPWLTAVAGLVWGLGCFVSFGLLALGPVMLVFLVLEAWAGTNPAPPDDLGQEARAAQRSAASQSRASSCPTGERNGREDAAPTRGGQNGARGKPFGLRSQATAAQGRPLPYARDEVVRAALHFGLLCAGLVVVALLVWFGLGVRLPEVWERGMAAHRQVTAPRTYGVWLGMNLLEFALFLGLPATVAVIASLYWTMRRRGQADGGSHLTYLALATVAVIALLDVSGRVRGEVGRIWLFLMPPLVLLAAERMWERRYGAALWGIAVGGQLVQVLMMVVTMTPIVRPW